MSKRHRWKYIQKHNEFNKVIKKSGYSYLWIWRASYPHRLLLNRLDRKNWKRSNEYVALSNLSIFYTWENIKKSHKNEKCKTKVLTWNEEFELPDGSYSDIQDYFKYILKNMKQLLIILK